MNPRDPDPPSRGPVLLYATTVAFSLKTFFTGHLNYMKDRGFSVLAVSSPGEMLREVGEREGVPVQAVAMERGISPIADVVAGVRLVGLLLRVRPTIVNASTPKAGLLVMLAAWATRVPVRVLVLHGLLTARRERRFMPLFRLISRLSCLMADRVFAVSHSVARGMIEERLCSPRKIKVLGRGSINGVDAERHFNPLSVDPNRVMELRRTYNLEPDWPVIGYVGRIVADKGIVELVQAWQDLRKRWDSLRLLIVGPREQGDPVPEGILHQLRNDERIIFTGYVDHAQIAPYYSLLRLLVLPTYREGFPTVLLEAGAMEIPVVATRVTGCVDAVLDGVTGTLVPVHDSQALAHAMEGYLTDPQLASSHGRAGRKRVLEDFRPDSIRKQLFEEYMRLLHEKGLSAAGMASM